VNVLLDTSAYSALQRGHQPILDVLRRSETVAVSAAVLGELYSGFRAGNRRAANTAQLAQFLSKPQSRKLQSSRDVPGESRAAGNRCHRKRSVEAHTVPSGGLGPERWQAQRNGQLKQVLKLGCWWFSITGRSRACNSHYLLRDILR
jgi:hypothetical protein